MPGQTLELPQLYVGGMWAAILCGVVFSAIYARRIAEEARQMSTALTATELILAREQRLSALDGLAAAAAHELGTPLATIALVAKELKRELPAEGPHAEDVDLLISQAARCREILSRLANRDAQADEMFARVKLTVMIEDIVAPLRGAGIKIQVDSAAASARAQRSLPNRSFRAIRPSPTGSAISSRTPSISPKPKSRSMRAGRRRDVSIAISDDGPGFAQEIFDRLGDPFVTTRPGYGPGGDESEAELHAGMGLGFFIAKTLLERSGATVSLANKPSPDHGAMVQDRLAARARRPRRQGACKARLSFASKGVQTPQADVYRLSYSRIRDRLDDDNDRQRNARRQDLAAGR